MNRICSEHKLVIFIKHLLLKQYQTGSCTFITNFAFKSQQDVLFQFTIGLLSREIYKM